MVASGNMRSQSDNATTERLMDILGASPIPLSTRDVGVRLRQRHLRLPDYKLSGILRDMLRDGKVEFKRGRWVMPSSTETINARSQLTPLPLSPEAISLLGWGSQRPHEAVLPGGVEWTKPEPEPSDAETPPSRWETFRKLAAYYRQCIRNEEGADASAFQNELGKRFVYLRKIGQWYPKPGIRWRASIPLAPHMSQLLNSLPGPSDDNALVIGYPIQAYYKENENEPDVAIIRPVFFFTVEHSVSRDGLVINCEDSRPEINLGWLDYAFSRKPDLQRSFLSACGFINRWRPNDEAPGLERAELAPSLENLVAALAAFIPEKIKQPLELISIPDHPLREPFETGIYNRAVLMLARRTKYTVTLLKELAAIEKAPNEVLNGTALYHIFVSNEDPNSVNTEEILHEAIVADTAPLNAEQRRAVASLLKSDITVVTGPPGTGKSQVVSCAAVNARLRGQTVLFASRNHKAIDAVIGRLVDNNDRSLMIRTNSKDDPNLKFTFANAIREMLAEQRDQAAKERLERAKEELQLLLDERGRNASYARRAAEAGSSLGELEERMSYLVKELPEAMVNFLDAVPERFPIKTFRKVAKSVHTLHIKSTGHTIFGKLVDIVRYIAVLPWYRAVYRILKRVPCSPQLPALPTIRAFKGLLPEIQTLERAME